MTITGKFENFSKFLRKKRRYFWFAGWGKTESGKQSDVLLKAYVPYVKNEPCVKRFAGDNIPIYETYLCAGGKNKTDVSWFIENILIRNIFIFFFQTCKKNLLTLWEKKALNRFHFFKCDEKAMEIQVKYDRICTYFRMIFKLYSQVAQSNPLETLMEKREAFCLASSLVSYFADV